jgi:hypothetical protein
MSVAQQRAYRFLSSQVDTCVASPPNEQDNVLFVLLDQHSPRSGEAGTEVCKFLINRSGFVMTASFEPGYEGEFNAIFDEYIHQVAILHPTDYHQ